jgi:2-oxoglutarate decarboxylase
MAASTTIEVRMPELGESVTEGTVLQWHKREGESVQANETLVEISTDKVDAEVPAPASGVVKKIYVGEGETIEVGTLLAEIDPNGAAPAEPAGQSSQGVEGKAGEQTLVDVLTPQAGESVSEGTILRWVKQVGEPVSENETIVEISTDKVDLELPAPATGVVAEILAKEGETVGVGQVIARIAVGAQAAPSGQAAQQAQPAAAGPSEAGDQPAGAVPPGVTPVAARVAAQLGVDPRSLTGSGARGRVTKEDVLAAASGNGAAAPPAAAPAAKKEPLRGGAAALVRYMEASRELPTATSFRTVSVATLAARREQLKEAGRRVSFTHIIAWAIVEAAKRMPEMARHFELVDGQPHRVDDGQINLGIAVDVELKDGERTLLVPVIKGADRLQFAEFLRRYDDLVTRARESRLTVDELQGANITLTNPGGIGTVASVPRLMPGQGTIVATGAITYPPGIPERLAKQLGVERIMTMTSTYDHRVIQGAQSGRFLAQIEAYLQGEDSFYERLFESLGVEAKPLAREPAELQLAAAPAPTALPDKELLRAVSAATALIKAYRTHGHLAAKLDPLGLEPVGDPSLDPSYHGLDERLMELVPADVLETYVPGQTLKEVLPHLRATYCGTIAYEIEHIASHRQRAWLREKIESGAYRLPLSQEEQRFLLKRLIEVDALERFMHKAYLGQHQFSIEGLDMTVPMLDELIKLSAQEGAQKVVLGMAHRGRLNVLAHNVGRPYDTIFAEFEGASSIEADALEAITTIPQGGTGDVKYHLGSRGDYALPDGRTIRVELESNPSHLEYVHPVVEGATRAAQTVREGAHVTQDHNAAIPIVIHGDASFTGQGVVAETLNLQGLDGYKVGGTIHIIMNNQIGFTTDPEDGRSTHWASDLAKGFDVPIIHVNADDVEACIAAVRLAFAFRQEFGHDVLIDLIGYRRYGHNESDEPAYTQPEMYAKIKAHKRVWEIWAEQLIEGGIVAREEVERTGQAVWDNLTLVHQRLKAKIEAAAARGEQEHETGEYRLDRTPSPDVATALPIEHLCELGRQLLRVPDGFNVHPKLVRQLERRREALESAAAGKGSETMIDWAHAEVLAFASLIAEGTPVRLSGQDTERGTFSQRHMVLHDAINGQEVCPIQSLPAAQAPFELHNSPLSELACLGFEYGYSEQATEEAKALGSRDALVLWEAQFGDFVNSAQVIVDQFIVSGLAKWGQTTRLTLLLPHGYEGAGPEHSSARLERFLQLAAEGNIRVANPTTPAQYFHLLRRQALIAKERPLIVMTPKSLLRLPQAMSPFTALSGESRFFPVLPEPGAAEAEVTRLILCTGKIYYDLTSHSERQEQRAVAIGRVELLYPFPQQELLALIARYPRLREVVWVQEEPRNMGARAHMFPRLMQIMPAHIDLGYIGRPERASPGEGYPVAHLAEQRRIVRTALDLAIPISQYPQKTPGER